MTFALPAWTWLRGYSRADLAADARAALIVTIMLVPQSLAYAQLAGLPPVNGLYASIMPLIAYAVFGSSRVLAVGPVAVISLMTAAALADFAPQGLDAYAGAALTLALLSGLMMMALGMARLGLIANLLSQPVMSGFITASAVLIAVGQLKPLLGLSATPADLVMAPQTITTAINAPTAIIGLAAVAWLFWARRGLQKMLSHLGLKGAWVNSVVKAAPLAAIAVGIAAVQGLGLEPQGVKIVGELPTAFLSFTQPSLDLDLVIRLAPSALLISLVGFVESVAVAHALAARRRQRIEPTNELLGLGAGNIAAALSGGFPVTGGFARSVVNFDAGAVTPMAGVITAVGMAIIAGFFTPLLHDLPQSVLAATVVVAVLSLVDVAALARTFAYSKADFTAMAATILVVWIEGVEIGIATGVAVTLALFLWRTARPHMAEVGRVPGSQHFRNIYRHRVIESPQVLSVRVDMSLYFVNARYLEDRIYDLALTKPQIKHVVLMFSAVNFIDSSALDSLIALTERLHAAGITLHLSEVKGPVMDRLKGSDFLKQLTGQVFLSQFDAYAALDPKAASDAGL